jgi:hypothetical protein
MNKRLSLSIAILLFALLASGCGYQIVAGSGNVVTENREVSGFHAVTLAGIGDVILTQGQTESLSIEAEDNLIPYFEIKVEAGTLVIGIKPANIGVNLQPTRPVKFYVSLPEIQAITVAGSGTLQAGDLQSADFHISLLGSGNISTGNLAAGAVNIDLAGSGDISLQAVTASSLHISILGSGNTRLASLDADSLNTTISGSGDVFLTGQVASQSLHILGSGDYSAGDLESQTADVTVSGSGSSLLSVSDRLDVNILGSGGVSYYGQPVINFDSSGSGDLTHLDRP